MNAQTINATFDLLALAERDTALKAAGAYHIGPCPFCGGKDRFTLKNTKDGFRWYCRNCGDGKYHTAIDYIMKRDNLDFKAAVSASGGEVQQHATRPRTEPAQPALVLPSDDWQRAAWQEIDTANDALLFGSDGQRVLDYLTGRGLMPGTWNAWNLGAAVIWGRPALVIPWWEPGKDRDTITAVKYRFIDDLAKKDKGQRFGMRKGSVPILFGLAYARPGYGTLLFVEGEINALSIWQCSPPGVDVISFGSESGGRPEILQRLAACYRRVFVWADEAEKAKKIQLMLSYAVPLQSPNRDGLKWDANQMLISGVLADFLQRVLAVT